MILSTLSISFHGFALGFTRGLIHTKGESILKLADISFHGFALGFTRGLIHTKGESILKLAVFMALLWASQEASYIPRERVFLN